LKDIRSSVRKKGSEKCWGSKIHRGIEKSFLGRLLKTGLYEMLNWQEIRDAALLEEKKKNQRGRSGGEM